MSGLRKKYNRESALFITSFPPQRYRRPLFAAKALKLLGLNTKLYIGWEILNSRKTLQKITNLSNKLKPPLNWLIKDMAYETSLLTSLDCSKTAVIINLNILGAASLRLLKNQAPLILDLQDVTIQDDGTIPFYDREMLKLSDLIIFTSRAIKTLVETNHPKNLRRTAYIPFGIDLEAFDKFYQKADPKTFYNTYNLKEQYIVTYTGAAYFWGQREGQGLELLFEAFSKAIKELENVKLVIQGAAQMGTYAWHWMQKQIEHHDLKQHVLLLPPMNPYNPIRMSMLKASDALLLPIGNILGTYFSEQQKTFEYMAAKRPIAMVATPARLCILNKNTAYISYERDAEEFAHQIILALENRDEAMEKAEKARQTVEKEYDWKILIPKYAELVASIIRD